MTITRENMIDLLSEKSGYWKKDVRELLRCMDEIVFDKLCEVDDDNEVSIQLTQGIKVSTHVVPSRERVDPRTQAPIVCKPTVKPMCKFSQDYRFKLQEAYDKKNG
jgi:nucleoid DNA-binding protein